MTRRILVAAVAAVVCTPGAASAHVERTSIWPDPAADTGVVPATGGRVPEYRPFATRKQRLDDFMAVAKRALNAPRRDGARAAVLSRWVALSSVQQKRVLAGQRTRRAAARLGLRTIQAPQDAQDVRVVCRPDSMLRVRRIARGLDRKRARKLLETNAELRGRCRYREIQPAVAAADNNDIVYVLPGFYQEPTSRGFATDDPRCRELKIGESEYGAGALSYEYQLSCPNDQNLIALMGRDKEGRCVRCNVQIEGTGASPSDVVIEAGKGADDGGKAVGPAGARADGGKDVPLRADRADGVYLRNFTVRHSLEHGVYVLETDGYVIDRVNSYYHGAYGFLMFVSDHGWVHHSEAVGNGDSGIYPGAAPDSATRMNTLIENNVARHNLVGYSGTMGNAVHVRDNDFYDNAVGISTDSLYAGGHPGYPQDSAIFEGNRIYSNNFNPYLEGSDVKPLNVFPVGTGIFIAGGNDDRISENWIYDNWRRGVMLFTIPDVLSGESGLLSTSHRNRFTHNRMGRSPAGDRIVNGVDFWWDELGTGNCWDRNGDVTSDPAALPDCTLFPNAYLIPNVQKTVMLAACSEGLAPPCDWTESYPKPGSGDGRRAPLRATFDTSCAFVRAGRDGRCDWLAWRR